MKKPYAIIQIQGKQEIVSQGDKIVVDHLDKKEGDELKVSDVLLYVDDKKTKIGTPTVDRATVALKVLSHAKAKKIRVAKFKAKSRYRKTKGHRQLQTNLEVISLKAES
ncbi:MAG: 50S ribosomal protein L21 [Patescibacteria group bacterium]